MEFDLVDGNTDPELVGRSFGPRLRANLPLASGIEPLVFARQVSYVAETGTSSAPSGQDELEHESWLAPGMT